MLRGPYSLCMFEHMFHLPLSVMEKIARPVIVYLCLILLLRVFGKRELAQLNPFDLVVLLSLSNTVQNAIIGDDNSLLGGVIGAVALLSANWIVNRILFRLPRVNSIMQGNETVLISDGKPDKKAMEKEILTRAELIGVLHKQGVHGIADVERCVLEPSGTFYVETKKDSLPGARHDLLLLKLEELGNEMKALREEIARRR